MSSLSAWAVTSQGPDVKPDITLDSYTDCVTAGRWVVGVTSWRRYDPVWLDTILLGEDRFEIRPRVRISPGRTVWLNLEDWQGTPYERKFMTPALDPVAFTEHALSRPLDWMQDTERQDMQRILGGCP